MHIHIWHKGQVREYTELLPLSIKKQRTSPLYLRLSGRGEHKTMPKIHQQAQLIT